MKKSIFFALVCLGVAGCSDKSSSVPEVAVVENPTVPQVNQVTEVNQKKIESSIVQKLFKPETLGMNIEYVEKMIGVPMYIHENGASRDYVVDDCKINLNVHEMSGAKSVSSIKVIKSPGCDVDIHDFVQLEKETPASKLSQLTFGSFVELVESPVSYYADCLRNCGNSYDPSVYLHWEGPRALNSIEIMLEAAQTSDAVIDAAHTWGEYMVKHIGEQWVDDGKFNCDTNKYHLFAEKTLSLVRPEAITVGYWLSHPKCESSEVTPSASSSNKVLDSQPYDHEEALKKEWDRIKRTITSNPNQYVHECMESYIGIAQELGGQDRETSLDGGNLEKECRVELADMKECMKKGVEKGFECYKLFSESREGD